MAQMSSTTEQDKTLQRLEQNFRAKLARITEQRMKLEKESKSSISASSAPKSKKFDSKPCRAKVTASLNKMLVNSRKVAVDFEGEILSEKTRRAWYDRLETLQRKQKELDRREALLVKSVREIEMYLRAIFFLKQEADQMHHELKDLSDGHDEMLRELKKCLEDLKDKREFAVKAMEILEPAKLGLQRVMSECGEYGSIKDLVHYYLALKELQLDILTQEAESAREEDKLAAELKAVERIIRMSKEETLLKVKTELKNTRNKIASLNEQIDAAVFSKVKDDAAWYEIQRYIQTLFQSCCEVKPLGPQELHMLDRIKDFVQDMQEIVQRLKK